MAEIDLGLLQVAGSAGACDALGRRTGLVHHVRPVTRNVSFCGRAVTAAVDPGDNRAAYEALDLIRPGDVLVVSCASSLDVAMVGGTLAGHCRNAGAVAIVTDGMVRDAAALETIGLPVWARGFVPNAPKKLGRGTVGSVVVIGDVAISHGDILVGDADGIAAVPKQPPEGFSERLRASLDREAEAAKAVARGDRAPAWLLAIRESEAGI